ARHVPSLERPARATGMPGAAGDRLVPSLARRSCATCQPLARAACHVPSRADLGRSGDARQKIDLLGTTRKNQEWGWHGYALIVVPPKGHPTPLVTLCLPCPRCNPGVRLARWTTRVLRSPYPPS